MIHKSLVLNKESWSELINTMINPYTIGHVSCFMEHGAISVFGAKWQKEEEERKKMATDDL